MNFFSSTLISLLFFLTMHATGYSQSRSKSGASQQKAAYYSEEHAMKCLEDYYDFYNADELYSDPRIRRVSNNVFYISLKYCIGGERICYTEENISLPSSTPLYIKTKNEIFWNSKVLKLTCTSKTKYIVTVKQ